ncbi:MAG: M56 family metallopeptidase [Tannerella sp.]|jgi:TonB family protein|nr:M56 family metallopeptidase [Tannerella sp.]
MMGVFFACSLKSALCLAVFYLFYKLLLSRETFHRFNRMALLGIMVLSSCIPFLAVLFEHTLENEWFGQFIFESGEAVSLDGQAALPSATSQVAGNRLLAILLLIYSAGCGVFLLHILRSSYGIVRLIRGSRCRLLDGRIRLAIHADSRVAPFSWMNCIVVSEKDMHEAGEIILMHEQAHIRQYHSVDLIFAELFLLFQWYNPAAWLTYGELQNIHEYEADRHVLNKGINAKQYQLLLIKKAVGAKLYSMANSFNHSNLKKRITMMFQKNSSSWARLKYTCVLPLAAIGMAAFARPEIARHFDGISSVKVSHFVLTDNPVEAKIVMETDMAAGQPVPIPETNAVVPPDSVYTVVEEMPEFPGGPKAMLDFISENLRYPVEAQAKGIQGRVTISFVVEKDGKLSNIEVRRSASPDLNAEALRVVSVMPVWKPGKVKGKTVACKYTLPINFRLTGDRVASGEAPTSTASASLSDEVFTVVEEMPEFPGGQQAMLDFVSENLRYPAEIHEKGIGGRVILAFVVRKDGKLSDVKVIRGINPELDAEAVRIINAMPVWKPGKMKGKTVNAKFTIPISFRL